MGTDIHYTFQHKNKDNLWEDVPVDTGWDTPYCINRHYFLFSILAGVRNGYGFAGIKTYEPVVPIDSPRGLPKDNQNTLWDEDYGESYSKYGDHSFSWLLSSEIKEYFEKYSKTIVTHTGYISRASFLKWDGNSKPESYSGGIDGPNIIKADTIPYNLSLLKALSSDTIYTHFHVEWKIGLLDEVQYFLDIILSLESQFGEIRMVFGFDS